VTTLRNPHFIDVNAVLKYTKSEDRARASTAATHPCEAVAHGFEQSGVGPDLRVAIMQVWSAEFPQSSMLNGRVAIAAIEPNPQRDADG